MTGKLYVRPLTLKKANAYIEEHHRHHKKVQGHRFSIGAYKDGALVGVAVVGRPLSQSFDFEKVAEVTRLCTNGDKNVCSLLYSACARAAKGMGFESIQTYILEEELGTSLKASGWVFDYTTSGATWNRKNRPRKDLNPTGPKKKYSTTFANNKVTHG